MGKPIGKFLLLAPAALLAVAASLAQAQTRAQTPVQPPPRGLFLVQPFDGPPLDVASLDVAASGEIVLAAVPPDGAADPGMRVARFDAAGRKLWERNPAPRSEFVSTVIARAVGADHTLVLHDETPKEQPQLALLRLDGKGQTLWRRELGPGAASDLAADGESGAVVSGSVMREKTGEIDALVMRVAPDGAPLWRRRFSGERKDGANSADLLRLGGGGAALVGGLADIVYDQAADTAVASRGMAMKLQADGQPAWRQFFGDGNTLSMVVALAAGSLGDAYVLALTEIAATGGHLVELVRLRSDGSAAWRRPLAGMASQQIYDMAATPDGGLALVGSEPQGQDQAAAILVLLDSEGIERTRVNYRGYKMRRGVLVRPHPAGGFVILFEGPAGSGFDTTNYLARVDAQGRF
ncbi:MAG: hypothetical protein AB7R90_11730 [Reyranellaceae bacterium]